MNSAYKAVRAKPVRTKRRILVVIEPEDIKAVDAWAEPAGQRCRSDALVTLIRAGLRAVQADQASGGL